VYKQPNFEELYNNWVKHGYDKWYKPSVDRLNDDKGYSFSNIQLVTWKENSDKQHKVDSIPIKVVDTTTGNTTICKSKTEVRKKFKTDRRTIARYIDTNSVYKNLKFYSINI